MATREEAESRKCEIMANNGTLLSFVLDYYQNVTKRKKLFWTGLSQKELCVKIYEKASKASYFVDLQLLFLANDSKEDPINMVSRHSYFGY
ncbi:hypothetical protein TNCT_317451 [Trichonephila clavata]|uniref:Uncharacterized protein n=1 Tax=Trichonephila clavata TaxID=2740835 RepID=A0A8X6F4M1_TRICU|nr:hypothetical protein TNCT_317451 [Trichonephila clavata]